MQGESRRTRTGESCTSACVKSMTDVHRAVVFLAVIRPIYRSIFWHGFALQHVSRRAGGGGLTPSQGAGRIPRNRLCARQRALRASRAVDGGSTLLKPLTRTIETGHGTWASVNGHQRERGRRGLYR